MEEEAPSRGWSEVEDLTVRLDEYNWPQYHAIAVDDQEVVHAFWFQSFYDGALEPSGEDVYYKTRTAGSWSDESGTFANHVGRHTGITLEPAGNAAFVWAEDVAGELDVFFARYFDPAGVPMGPARAAASLRILPNPCRAEAFVTFVLDGSERVRLDLYDVSGRLVTRLADGIRAAGSHTLRWDGRDARGRRVSSAIYHARLMIEGQSATATIVLIE